MSWSRSWGRKLKCLIVQLKGRAKLHGWTWRWLHLDDSFTVRQNDRAFDIPLIIFVDVNATFLTQYLL